MTNILSDLRRLTEAVHAAGADIAPTYREYVQLAFAIATDCGEAGRSDFLMLCSLSAKYDVHAANKLFSNALKTNNNSVHIGTAFHLAELCNVRPRPAEKPRQDAPAGTLGTPGAPHPAASHTHAHGYYNRAEMPAEEFPEAPAASLPAEAADAGTACSGTANAGTTYPGTTYPEAADEETCRGSEPLTPLPCFDNRTLWPAPLNEITAHGTTRAQQDIMLLGAVTVLGASMNSHVRCAYGGKMISPSLQTFIVALPASGKGVLSLVRLLVEPIHDEIRLHTAEAMKQYRKEKGAYDSLGKERSQATPPALPPDRMFLISGNNTGTGILQNIMDSEGIGLICESEADTISTAIGSEHGHWKRLPCTGRERCPPARSPACPGPAALPLPAAPSSSWSGRPERLPHQTASGPGPARSGHPSAARVGWMCPAGYPAERSARTTAGRPPAPKAIPDSRVGVCRGGLILFSSCSHPFL